MALLLHTARSKRGRTGAQNNKPQIQLTPLRETNEEAYSHEGSVIFEIPMVPNSRDVGALLALHTTTTPRPHYDHYDHHHHHHHKPTNRPPKIRPRPCDDEDEDSDECDDNYYVRPSWQYGPPWYAAQPLPPTIAGPILHYYGPHPIYYPPPPYYPLPYYTPPYYHHYPPTHIYNHTHIPGNP